MKARAASSVLEIDEGLPSMPLYMSRAGDRSHCDDHSSRHMPSPVGRPWQRQMSATEQKPRDVGWPGLRKGAQFAGVLAYYWLLCWTDQTLLAPAFSYQGLNYRSAATWTQIGVTGLILLCTALTPVRLRHPSDGVLYVLLPLVVIPILTVATTDALFANVAGNLVFAVTGAYLVLAVCSMLPRPQRGTAIQRPLRRPWLLAILLSAVSYGLMFATFGVHLRLLSFGQVYTVRAVFSEQAPGALGYLLDWQASVINPLFIVYGIRFRRSLPLLAGLLGDLLIYSATGFKSVLLSVLLIAAFLLAMRQKNPTSRPPAAGARLSFAFAALVFVSGVIDTLSHGIAWTSLFVRRLSLVAGVNTGYYFQYFSTDPRTHLAYGIVGKILGTGPVVPPPQQIAVFAYHTTSILPDANLWADAYANFGDAGVVFFTLVLAAFLWYYDWLACNVDVRAATVLIIAPALSLANSALLTCLLTHGMLLALLVVKQWPHLAPQATEQSHARTSHVGLVRLARR